MIMDESYKQELLEYIAETPDVIFEAYNHTRESVLQHIEELWTAYQKDVEEYDCTADWSYADAMQEVLGILIPNTAAPWHASEPARSAKITYADQIRQMSDEELAKLLTVSFTYINGYRPDTVFRCVGVGDFDTREEAETAALEMLKKPANSDGCFKLSEINIEEYMEKMQRNAWNGKNYVTVFTDSNDKPVLKLCGHTYEPIYESFSATCAVYGYDEKENKITLFDETDHSDGAYRKRVETTGSMEEVQKYIRSHGNIEVRIKE